ncbi:peptidase M23 [Candidatus Magnetomorum sp. HK-1]|nr:peptidase M23 [Candidatus Magnetomorum sp. HK-1]
MNPKHLLNNLLNSYSMLLFMRNRWVGCILFCITILNPNLAFSGIISWITTLVFARAIGIHQQNLVHSIYTYNSLIVGFSIGFLFKISVLSVLLTVGTSVLTVMLSYALYSLLTQQMKLPVLNIPFFIVSTIIYLASARYSSLFVDSFYSYEGFNLQFLPLFLQGLFKTTGNLIFMPYDIPGILVLMALFLTSFISFILVIFSYYTGICCLAYLKGSFTHAFFNFSAFNFILIGIALGSIFLIPSRRSYFIAITGVFVSVFILDAASVVWSVFRIPVFTLPFNVVVLLFIYVLRQIGYPYMNDYIQDSPEKSLTYYLNYSLRFDRITPQPNLPFMGVWTVYQSFDGQWTHQGNWKYAYDFVITDENNQTYKNEGIELSDYYCFGKPVLSPVEGTIVDVFNTLKDFPIGEVDKHHNWGNYCIIYSIFGYYIEISHFQEKSIKVKVGDIVKPGMVLGLCGNSGYSPQPHIHMQIQYWPQLGSATAPFYFSNCINPERFLCGNMVLAKDAQVEPLTFSRKRNQTLNFILDDSFLYSFSINDQEIKTFRITVKMDIDGSYFFHLEGSNDFLYFGIEQQRFIFYRFIGKKGSPLSYIFAAIPMMPITIDKNIQWTSILPGNVLGSIPQYLSFLQSIDHRLNQIKGTYKLSENNKFVEGKIKLNRHQVTTKVLFHKIKGFKEIEVINAKKHIIMSMIEES